MEYELKNIDISKLKFDETNPNKMTKEQQDALKKAFHRFGYLVPIVINEKFEIGDGEHRALVYKDMGIKSIPAYIVPKINNDIERRLLRQTMNKLRGKHEIKMDADEIALIFEHNKLDDLTTLLAKDRTELENILTKHKGIEFQHEDNFDIDKTLEDLVPITKLGDIWQLGNHRLICADCSDEKSILKVMQGKKADMVFTDPPYGVDYASKNRFLNSIWFANRIEEPILGDAIEDYYEFYKGFLSTLVLNETNSIYVTISGQKLLPLLQILKDLDFHLGQILVWVKNNHVLGRQDYANIHELIVFCWKGKHEFYGDFQTTVWEIDRPLSSRLHPTMKPIELIARAINNSSKSEGLIYDPFLGSGSTLIACEQTNRICYGVEIDPHYCDVIVKRWEQFTNKKAVRLNDKKEHKK